MRNIFDQYDQYENRLTHALAVCLNEDRALLRDFLKWQCLSIPKNASGLTVIEQGLPGDSIEATEEEAQGLPDIVVHTDDGWCLFIESKVEARLTKDQLWRHRRTLERRGFSKVIPFAIVKAGTRAMRGVRSTSWPELYSWAARHLGRTPWADRLRSYLRIAERRLAIANYLREGTLTMFDGFHFTDDNPYSYREAKRLLKLAMAEVRRDPALRRLGVDAQAPGRPSITGKEATAVWDFLQLSNRPRRQAAQKWPHLTLALHTDRVEVAITIPNASASIVRKRLAALGPDGLALLNSEILKGTKRRLPKGAWVEAHAVQRHYLTQRSHAVKDAEMSFNLATSIAGGRDRVKHRPEWNDALFQLLRRRKANVQFGYRVMIPWGTKGLNSRKSLDLIVESWFALKPLLTTIGNADGFLRRR